MTARQELSFPPTITLDQVKGFTLYATRSVLSGTGRRAHRPRPHQRHPEGVLVKASWRHLRPARSPARSAPRRWTSAVPPLPPRRRQGRRSGSGSRRAASMGWDEASAPGQVGQKVERLVTRRGPARRRGPAPRRTSCTGRRASAGASSTRWSRAPTSTPPLGRGARPRPGGLAVELRGPAARQGLQADLEVRRAHPRRRPVRPPRVRRDDDAPRSPPLTRRTGS